MLRIIFRYFLVGLAALAIVLVAFTLSPAIRAENADFSACRNEPSAQCLTDLGVDLAISARSLPPYMREVDMLAQMGRIEDALALQLRVVGEKDRPPENIEATVNRSLASHRITAAIRKGMSLDTAIDRTPEVDPVVLWIGALDLLGRNPYGGQTSTKIIPDDQILDVVSDMAERIATMAQVEPDRLRTTHLKYSVELQTALGNRADVIQLLEALPQTQDLRISPSEDLIRLVGSQDVLRLYREAGGTAPNILLRAASAETNISLATEYLQKAFVAFSSRERWPDFNRMERTVERAANRGLQELALELAHELADQAETAPSVLPVFPHINAARALLVAGADQDAVQERLELARESFPKNDRAIVGIGFTSGAILWGSSGLDAEARREIANLRARMGDLDAAIQNMDGIDEPVVDWNYMLSSEIPTATLDGLLDAASDVMSKEEHAYIRAQHAQEILVFGGSDEQRSWAYATATELLQAPQMDGDRAVLIYRTLARIGTRLEDQDIQLLALERMAAAAIASRDFSDLIVAGFEWHRSDLTP